MLNTMLFVHVYVSHIETTHILQTDNVDRLAVNDRTSNVQFIIMNTGDVLLNKKMC